MEKQDTQFKLQAILDLGALLRTMCYVDLNPVRAKMAKTPEDSRYTSVRRRLKTKNPGLMKFASTASKTLDPGEVDPAAIPITFKQYLELLDYTGRQLRQGKRGSINAEAPSIMARLGYTPEQWKATQEPSMPWLQKALGHAEAIKDYCKALDQRWIWQCVG